MITAGLAILLSISIIVTEFRGNSASIRRKMLDGYSDSQIMQGIGIQSEFQSRAHMQGENARKN